MKKIIALSLLITSCSGSNSTPSLDTDLSIRLNAFNITSPQTLNATTPEKVELGQKLFFDKILSGNRDTACSTCHSPTHATTDGLTLSIGTGGSGTGPEREIGTGDFIARNAQDLFNRGFTNIHTMFTDSRISGTPQTGFISPAGDDLPNGLENILAVQALFPIASRSEMLGEQGENELANLNEEDFTGIWQGIMDRLLAITEYQNLFLAAYPDKSLDDLTIADAANAISAFETDAFTFTNSSFDRYLNGDTTALSDTEKRGAILFYGRANCITCHSGPLLFDQNIDNILTPLIGPGKGEPPLDIGIQNVSGKSDERFAFRSAPLRNVELTAPYMHNGAFATLEAVVDHYNDPLKSLQNYDSTQIDDRLENQVHNTSAHQLDLIGTFSEDTPKLNLSNTDKSDLVAFLKSLTDPAARDLSDIIPDTVPSALSIDP